MAAIDYRDTGFDGPASKATAVTAAGTELPGGPTRGVYVAADGDLTGIMASDDTADGAGTAVTFTGVKGGAVYPFRMRIISACPAGTVALY
jgi:hypothetical protein